VTDDELVTVVIPARNEQGTIGDCLASVLAQHYTALQIVVVDGDSDDLTSDVVENCREADSRIELIHNSRRNIPSSLNLGLAAARGDWLVRVDAHSTIGPSYVRLAVRRLREGTWGGVGGRKDGVGRTPAGRAIAVALGSRFGVGNSAYHYATSPQEVDHLPFGCYPVELVRRLGGWDERLTANEDFEFDYRLRRAGHRLLLDPELVIKWHCRQSIRDLYRQYHRYGRGKVDVAVLHPTSVSLRHLVPPLFVAFLGTTALLNARRPHRLLLSLLPYLVCLAGESLVLGRHLESSRERTMLPAAFAAMHVGWGVGFWAGAMSKLHRARGPRPS
jgi:glycosyltransferase involved in cell wall biosynthesis